METLEKEEENEKREERERQILSKHSKGQTGFRQSYPSTLQ